MGQVQQHQETLHRGVCSQELTVFLGGLLAEAAAPTTHLPVLSPFRAGTFQGLSGSVEVRQRRDPGSLKKIKSGVPRACSGVLQGFPALSWGGPPVCGEGAPGLELGHLMFCLQWGLAVGGQSNQCHGVSPGQGAGEHSGADSGWVLKR